MLRRLWPLRSLRWRLTLAYTLLVAVLLAAFGAFSFLSLRGSLIDNRIASLQGDYNAAHVVITRLANATTVARGRQLCAAAPSLVGRTVATVISQATGHSVGVLVYDAALVVTASVPVGDQPQLDPAALQRVVTSNQRSAGEVIATPAGDQLVVGFPVDIAQRICGVAQLAAPMAPLEGVLNDELVLVGAGGAAVLVLTLLVGLVLTGRTLRPLRRLNTTAQQLAAGDLRARSRLVPRDDEVGALTRSFDDMADRIEELFAARQASEEQVRRFIADASHELRTPVTALKGYIDVLRRGAGRDPEALESALQAMGGEAERMRQLVLDLLTLARIDAHRELTPERIDINAELGDLLDTGMPGITGVVERHFPPEALDVLVDRGAVDTIFRNLLVNANKYAPGATQRWSTSVDAGRVRVDVHDDGPGIPAADQPHVFERFYRGEKTRAREEGGSGLGLSIVQGLARSMGGDVAISSVEGRGTTVSVWLPAAPAL